MITIKCPDPLTGRLSQLRERGFIPTSGLTNEPDKILAPAPNFSD